MEISRRDIERGIGEVEGRLSQIAMSGEDCTSEYWELKARLYTLNLWYRQGELQQPSQFAFNQQSD
jgi:hypothetical protein